MLISAVQQSDSVICIYTFYFTFFSIMVYHRILNIVLYAIQYDLVVYPFYIYVCVCVWVCVCSVTQLCPTLCNPVVCSQASLSMEFSRQEYWTGLPFPSPGGLLGPGIKCEPLVSPALAGRFSPTVPPGKPLLYNSLHLLIPNSQFILPLLPFPFDNHRSVVCVCEE